ncbi:MAG: flagellar filament capping protein FliD [Hungatella hathewayi]|nr:flagellar filament capping protein FliD [Hungatella hathewayi]
MDTESLVTNLLAGTQSKIDKQSGLKQQLTWKQEMYRSIITEVNNFRDKYFSYTNNDTNLLGASLYKTMKGTSSSDAVKIGAVGNNAASNMTINQVEQLATACTVKSQSSVTGDAIAGRADLGSFTRDEEYSFTMILDGVSRTISFKGGANANDTLANINQAIYRNFGASVSMSVTGDGNMRLDMTDTSRRVIIEAAGDETSTAENLGFGGGYSNKLNYSSALKDLNFNTTLTGNNLEFEINGVAITGLTKDSNLSDVILAINNSGAGVTVSYSSTTDKFIMQSNATGDISNISMSDTSGNLLKVMFGGTPEVISGQNAKLIVDGTEIQRNTNTFELDGITIELTGTTSATDSPINLTTSQDTDKIVDSLKSFVEDYNALIAGLNSRIREDATYKSYPPLTAAQKKEMSDREIELWEEKSKEGLLRNDSNISGLLSSMRTALYSTVDGAGIAIFDIGIETSSNWKDNGKLILDEEKLKAALTTNADAVQKLFTDSTNGLAVKLQDALKAAANVSSASPGTMVQYAGTKDVLTTNNTLYHEMKTISDVINRLNQTYEREKTRYWKQFTAMEQSLANLNTQSSWLNNQFS